MQLKHGIYKANQIQAKQLISAVKLTRLQFLPSYNYGELMLTCTTFSCGNDL